MKSCYPFFRFRADLPNWAMGVKDSCKSFDATTRQSTYGVCCVSRQQFGGGSQFPGSFGQGQYPFLPQGPTNPQFPPQQQYPPQQAQPVAPPQSVAVPVPGLPQAPQAINPAGLPGFDQFGHLTPPTPPSPPYPVPGWPPGGQGQGFNPAPTTPVTPATTTTTTTPRTTTTTTPYWTPTTATTTSSSNDQSSSGSGATTKQCGVGPNFPIRYAKDGVNDEESLERIYGEHPLRIVNGWQAENGEWPWIAMMLNNGRPFCGGALIDDKHILTAAHCISQ